VSAGKDINFETLATSRDQEVLRVVMNRPQVANAMNTVMGGELRDLFRNIKNDTENLRCVVLTGAGERAFCAGADLKERNGMTDAQWSRQHAVFESAAVAIMDCPLPLIGAVNGAAFGGGMELVLACDFAWGSSAARFALTETTLGIIPGLGSTQYLPRAVGTRRAKEIIFSGLPFGADEALEWGLLNRLCRPENLVDDVMTMAHQIAANAPIAINEAKQSLNHALQANLKEDYEFELERYRRTIPTRDRLEGIAAFNEKRKPVFKGE
jgi:enoyl-CoA hydratase/carnithine racemase